MNLLVLIKYFLTGLLLVMVGFILVLSLAAVLEYFNILDLITQIGSIIGIILLSIAVGHSFYHILDVK